MKSRILNKIFSNDVAIGAWVQIGHLSSVESLAEAGFDWICLDLEHGIISLEQIPGMLSVIEQKAVSFVRLPRCDKIWIHRMLDYGVNGIISPMINSGLQAQELVELSKYPPKGNRGFGYSRCNRYGNRFFEYSRSANDEIIVVAQIEHIDAIAHIDEILSVKGIDATVIGPYDLSGSMGIPGQFDDNRFVEAIDEYIKASLRHNIPAGMHIVHVTEDAIRASISNGYKFVALGTDCVYLYESAKKAVSMLKRDKSNA